MIEIVRQNKLTKNSAVYKSFQAQLIGWMHLIIFTQIIHLQIHTISQRRKRFSTFF